MFLACAPPASIILTAAAIVRSLEIWKIQTSVALPVEPNHKLPFLSSKTEKNRAELSALVTLVNDFPSYRKTPSHEAIQMLPFLSCMILRTILSGPEELITSLALGLILSFLGR